MQNINFYLVSIFLSSFKLSQGTSPFSTTLQPPNYGSVVSNKISNTSNSSISYPRSSNNNLTVGFSGSNTKSNSLPNLNTSSKTALSAVNNNTSDSFTSKNSIAQLADSSYDNPGEPNSSSFNLYNAIACIFKLIFKTWQGSQSEINDIAKCFKIPNEIVQIVNDSMAIMFVLLFNNKIIKIFHLAKVFYYMFDIEHMIQRDKNRETAINITKSLIKNIEQDRALNTIGDYGNSDLNTVVINLKNLLKTLKNGHYNNRDIMVNAALMKGLMLINITENNEFNYELNKLRRSLSNDFLKNVEDNQYEIDGLLIAKNHAEVIRNTMPCVFTLLDNHIELLKTLSTHTLDDKEMEEIQIANRLHKAIISTFVNRFKNFGNPNQKEISDLGKITQLLEILDTGKTDQETTDEYSKTVQKNTQDLVEENPVKNQEPSTPKLDITELLALRIPAIKAVLNLAGQDEQIWASNTIFKFKNVQTKQKKEYYMDLLTHNADTAYLLIDAFEKKFLSEINYKKFHGGGNQDYFI